MSFTALLVGYALIGLAIGISFRRYLRRNRSDAAPWEVINASGLWIFFAGWILFDLLRGKGLGPAVRPAGHPRLQVRVARSGPRARRRSPRTFTLPNPTMGFTGPIVW